MQKGYTLIETLIAITIVMIVSLVFIKTYPSASISLNKNKYKSEAMLICKNEIEVLKSNKGKIEDIFSNNNGKLIENQKGYEKIIEVKKDQESNILIIYKVSVEVKHKNINPIKLTTKILFSK